MHCRSIWILELVIVFTALLSIAAVDQEKPAAPAKSDLILPIGAGTAPTTVTLTADQMPVFDLLAEIEKQTGNHIVDHRQATDDEHMRRQKVSIAFRDEPFWSAIDQVLDQWRLGVDNYGGGDALAIVEREPGERPRRHGAVYSGPFRLQILEVSAQDNLRKPERKSLKLAMEVAWEPRLRPIALMTEGRTTWKPPTMPVTN